MSLTLNCPACGHEIEAPKRALGRVYDCPACGRRVELPLATLETGTTLAGFTVKKLLGVGAMGEVYLARQLSMERDVALKLLPPEMLGSPDRVQRFMNEVRTLARLDHPNVVAAFEAGSEGPYQFLAMSYVSGETLEHRVERLGPLPEPEAIGLALKAAETLAYFWDNHRTLHRDIKPANIMIDTDGQFKLMDMGISRRADDDAHLTRTGLVVGTPHYMSPEQAMANRDLDFTTDMYSLGGTLYTMVTGKLPYEADSAIEILTRHVQEPPPSARTVNPAVSPGLDDVIRTMMAKDPRDRYPDWQTLIRDFKRLRRGQFPVHARAGAGTVVVPGPKPRDNFGVTIAATAALLATVAVLGVSVAGIQALRTRQERLRQGTAEHQRQQLLAAQQTRQQEEEERQRLAAAAEEERLAAAAAERKLKTMLAEAIAFAAAHPDDHAAAVARLQDVVDAAPDTPYAKQANQRIAALHDARAAAHAAALETLDRQVAELVEAGKFDEAVDRLTDDNGPFAGISEAARQERRRAVEDAQQAAAEQRRAARDLVDQLELEVARRLLVGDFGGALERLNAVADRPEFAPVKTDLAALREQVAAVAQLPRQVIAGFVPGDEVQTVYLKDGAQKARVAGTDGLAVDLDVLVGENGQARIRKRFGYNDLAPREKLRRLPEAKAPADYLGKGILYAEAGKFDGAEKYFLAAASPLSRALLRQLDAADPERGEGRAAGAYGALLGGLGLKPDTPRQTVIRTVWEATLPNGFAAAVAAWLYRFERTTFAGTHRPELAALDARTTVPPVAATPANLTAALQALAEANPDAAPLRVDQRSGKTGPMLDLAGNPRLANVAGLRGLQVAGLSLQGSAVRDVEPLRGMPLYDLDLSGTPVQDLTPLTGMPLDTLALAGSRVRDLTPLAGITLASLDLSGTRVRDLAPLADARIRELHLHDVGTLTDPGTVAKIDGVEVLTLPKGLDDYAFLGLMPQLSQVGRGADELLTPSALLAATRPKPIPLERPPGPAGPLGLFAERYTQRIRYTNPKLRGEPELKVTVERGARGLIVHVAPTRKLDNLLWARGMPIGELTVADCGITDLGLLAHMQIERLDVSGNPIETVDALAKMPLRELRLHNCARLKDVSALAACKSLERLTIPADVKGVDALRELPNLKYVQTYYKDGWKVTAPDFFRHH